MEFYNYITGKSGLMILGLIAISVFIYKKFKTQQYFKHIDKKEKERKSK